VGALVYFGGPEARGRLPKWSKVAKVAKVANFSGISPWRPSLGEPVGFQT